MDVIWTCSLAYWELFVPVFLVLKTEQIRKEENGIIVIVFVGPLVLNIMPDKYFEKNMAMTKVR